MAEMNSEQTTTTTTTPDNTNNDDLGAEHFENNDGYDDSDDDDQIDLSNADNTGFTDFSTSNADNSAKTDYYDENNVSSEWSDNDGYELEYADDDNEYDTLDDNTHTMDDAIYRQFFEQLIEAKKLSALKQQNAQFFPSTRRYLNASFVDREKMLNKRMQTNLLYIAKCIVDGKIRLRLPEVDKEFMLDILDPSTPKEDARLYLLEDRRLHLYFRKALQLIEQQQQQQKQTNGRQRTKTNNDRQRKVQCPNGVVTGNNATSKNSQRFNSNTRSGRTSGESSRNGEICES
jgi:hypothetical protein